MLAKYGDRLIATHINDNLGIKDYDGKITYLDDLHLLPFDGVKDWSDFGRRMKQSGYQGELTFELKISNQKNRHENDVYLNMPFEQYLTEAYKRACRVAVLVQG
jgi:sugar phosphate isomerase/epimerase